MRSAKIVLSSKTPSPSTSTRRLTKRGNSRSMACLVVRLRPSLSATYRRPRSSRHAIIGYPTKGGAAASRTSNPSATLIFGGVNRSSAAREEPARANREDRQATHRELCRIKTNFKCLEPVSFMIEFRLMFLLQKDDVTRTLTEHPRPSNSNWSQTRYIRVVFRFFVMIIRRATTA